MSGLIVNQHLLVLLEFRILDQLVDFDQGNNLISYSFL